MEDACCENVEEALEHEPDYASPIEETSVHVFVQDDNWQEHILPDNLEDHVPEMEEETGVFENDEIEEETEDIKPEIHEPQIEYPSDMIELHESFSENVENHQRSDFQNLPEHLEEQQEDNFEFETNVVEEQESQSEEESEYQEKDQAETEQTCQSAAEDHEFAAHLEENRDVNAPEAIEDTQHHEEGEEEEEEQFHPEPIVNDSDENDYEIVEALHITGDLESSDEHPDNVPTSNILRHALKTNKEASKIVKKDNKLYLQYHNLKSSIKRAQPEYKYKCENCESTFINNILLKKHMCSKLFNCLVCKRRFPDMATLDVHKRTHAKQQMVHSTAVAEVSPKKPKPPPPQRVPTRIPLRPSIKCKTCGKLCSSTQILGVHMKSHKELVCGSCAKPFASQLMLEKHVRESCVKQPQLNRRSPRINSAGNDEQKSKRGDAGDVAPKTPRSCLKVKCETCGGEFGSFQAVFKHKVVEHALQTPDTKVLDWEEEKSTCSGVPASRKLQIAFAELKRQLDSAE